MYDSWETKKSRCLKRCNKYHRVKKLSLRQIHRVSKQYLDIRCTSIVYSKCLVRKHRYLYRLISLKILPVFRGNTRIYFSQKTVWSFCNYHWKRIWIINFEWSIEIFFFFTCGFTAKSVYRNNRFKYRNLIAIDNILELKSKNACISYLMACEKNLIYRTDVRI